MELWSKNSLVAILISLTSLLSACEKRDLSNVVVATMGASLMYSGNGWVEIACTKLGVQCINKAVSSTKVYDYADQLWRGTYASEEELKTIDILLIQFANCDDVCGDEETFFTTAQEYTNNFDTTAVHNQFRRYSTAQCMDYLLKEWQQICIRNNKEMHVLFVTHWHDSRITYNNAVRRLADRWNAEVVELDKKIGFTKEELDQDGNQPSIRYAVDTEQIDGITYGWHPLRGERGLFIQNKMGNILYKKLKKYIFEHSIE